MLAERSERAVDIAFGGPLVLEVVGGGRGLGDRGTGELSEPLAGALGVCGGELTAADHEVDLVGATVAGIAAGEEAKRFERGLEVVAVEEGAGGCVVCVGLVRGPGLWGRNGAGNLDDDGLWRSSATGSERSGERDRDERADSDGAPDGREVEAGHAAHRT